jgi:hypothetical protein
MYLGPLDYSLEFHEVVLTKYEVEYNTENLKPVDYLFFRATKKANELGLSGRKIKSTSYSQSNDGDWTISFGCERA